MLVAANVSGHELTDILLGVCVWCRYVIISIMKYFVKPLVWGCIFGMIAVLIYMAWYLFDRHKVPPCSLLCPSRGWHIAFNRVCGC